MDLWLYGNQLASRQLVQQLPRSTYSSSACRDVSSWLMIAAELSAVTRDSRCQKRSSATVSGSFNVSSGPRDHGDEAEYVLQNRSLVARGVFVLDQGPEALVI